MTGQQDEQTRQDKQARLLKLYRLVPGRAVKIYEVSEENLSQTASTRSAKAHEICDLIEELLEHLSEDERQTFKQRIKTEGMI